MIEPIEFRIDSTSATATEAINTVLIIGQVKPKTTKIYYSQLFCFTFDIKKGKLVDNLHRADK